MATRTLHTTQAAERASILGGADAFKAMAANVWQISQSSGGNGRDDDSAILSVTLAALKGVATENDGARAEGFARALIDLLFGQLAESGLVWLEQWDPIAATGGSERLLRDPASANESKSAGPAYLALQSASTGLHQACVLAEAVRDLALSMEQELQSTGAATGLRTAIGIVIEQLCQHVNAKFEEADNALEEVAHD